MINLIHVTIGHLAWNGSGVFIFLKQCKRSMLRRGILLGHAALDSISSLGVLLDEEWCHWLVDIALNYLPIWMKEQGKHAALSSGQKKSYYRRTGLCTCSNLLQYIWILTMVCEWLWLLVWYIGWEELDMYITRGGKKEPCAYVCTVNLAITMLLLLAYI